MRTKTAVFPVSAFDADALRARTSIRARMTLAFACSLATFMLLACLALTGYARQAAERSAQAVLENASERVRQEVFGDKPGLDPREIREVQADILSEHLALMIRNAQGQIVARAGDADGDSMPADKADNRNWRTLTFTSGQYQATLGLSWTPTQSALNNQAWLLLALSLVTCGAGTLGAWVLVGRTLSPIGRLSQQARSVGAAAGDVRLTASSQDAEVVELVATLNALLARQREAAASRERFYAAASHELRTPLQALSGHLELALQRPRTSQEYFAVVEEATAQTRRLTLLVRDLLRLHQLESQSRPVQEEVDLSQTCDNAVRALSPLAQTGNVTVDADVAQGVLIVAAPSSADMMARNLLENALRYATPGSKVTFGLTQTQTDARLEVANLCELQAGEQPQKWLEAFYRPDISRHARTGGNGLGLAICKAVADANGWKLSLDYVNGRVTARVEFPVSHETANFRSS